MALHDLVVDYAGIGDHRTGTAADDRTRAWFSDELVARGCSVSCSPYSFPRFVADVEVTVDGDVVESLPLWYSWTGVVDGVATLVRTELTGNWTAGRLEDARRLAVGPVVAATIGAIDAVITPNRAPHPEAGPVTVLVAPSSVAGANSVVRLRGSASVVDGRSANVVGRRGPASDEPLILPTPLSGWFGCAAERGTGIAVLLRLLDRLPAGLSLLVLGTTGHELEHLGAQAWLAGPGAAMRPRAVVHLGASVAACEPTTAGPELAPRRFALLRLPGGVPRDAVVSPLEHSRFVVADEPTDWLGEGRQWSTLGVPLLSFVGTFSRFHTAHDRPFLTTDPTLLDLVAGDIAAAVAAFEVGAFARRVG